MNNIVNIIADNKTLIISIVIFFICVIIGFFGDLYLKKHNKMLSENNKNDDALQKVEKKEEVSEEKVIEETLDNKDINSTYESNDITVDNPSNNDLLNENFVNNGDISSNNNEVFNEPNISNDNKEDTYQYSNINFNTDDDNKFNNMF